MHHTVRKDYVPALCTHRPSLLLIECDIETLGVYALTCVYKESRNVILRRSKSRNKVSVGEPSEGSSTRD